ncbi:MAG: nickel-dependent hydrogenase large subunit [Candidatus Riflebacteria bacterium]|nr:nickel-dependent hydrogenase large subunit [Candidatus Riflebacteria bacterium]
MGQLIALDPVTRIEGHLSIKIETENNRINNASCSGDMFRGFEQILQGRNPLDAPIITQRICGICPISHAIASVSALEAAFNVAPPSNAILLRNLMLGADFIQSHILHFYHLSALDFIDVQAILKYQGSDTSLLGFQAWVKEQLSSNVLYPASPFLPRYSGDYIGDPELNTTGIKHYLEAFEMRMMAHQAAALFSGKMPHSASIVPGGSSEHPAQDAIDKYRTIMQKLVDFIEKSYIPDVIEISKAFPSYFSVGAWKGGFLCVGVFPEINNQLKNFIPSGVCFENKVEALDEKAFTEDSKFSYFSSSGILHPSQGETNASPGKTGAYSWIKAPRYNGKPLEVGPLARAMVSYPDKNHPFTKEIDDLLKYLNLNISQLHSVFGRHAARALETKIIARKCLEWISQLKPGDGVFTSFTQPDSGKSVGYVEAPRGSLNHWIQFSGGKIGSYQCVVPTTWNCSPRDSNGTPGPVEQALLDTAIADPGNPIEAARVVRSFDPCLACAVH